MIALGCRPAKRWESLRRGLGAGRAGLLGPLVPVDKRVLRVGVVRQDDVVVGTLGGRLGRGGRRVDAGRVVVRHLVAPCVEKTVSTKATLSLSIIFVKYSFKFASEKSGRIISAL